MSFRVAQSEPCLRVREKAVLSVLFAALASGFSLTSETRCGTQSLRVRTYQPNPAHSSEALRLSTATTAARPMDVERS